MVVVVWCLFARILFVSCVCLGLMRVALICFGVGCMVWCFNDTRLGVVGRLQFYFGCLRFVLFKFGLYGALSVVLFALGDLDIYGVSLTRIYVYWLNFVVEC